MTKAQAGAYLAGMIDGEGHVRVNPYRAIYVSNTDRDLIDATAACCDLLGLRYRIQENSYDRRGDRKPIWHVCLTGKDTLEAVARLVPLQSQRKVALLEDGIAAYKYRQRPPREWVEQKYVVEGLSLQQVAEAWGVKNSTSAWAWMDYYGIPRRSISDANLNRYRQQREAIPEDG